jgi:D-inositol-3-phosphate glycosyltransferase
VADQVVEFAIATSSRPSGTENTNGAGRALTTRTALEVGLLTGGFDKPYALGLAMALVSQDVHLDVIGSDDVDSPEMHMTPTLRFLNLLRSERRNFSLVKRTSRVLIYYIRLIFYVTNARPNLFHILWNNKIQLFDRTLLMVYYKFLGKRVVLTAHNVNAGKRDLTNSWLNLLTLKIQYRLTDHIFVHTEKMKTELINDFGVQERVVTVIPFGINNSAPKTDLTPKEAKHKLGIRDDEKTILFFGNIGPYKGIDILVTAFQQIAPTNIDYRLIIAGKPRGGCERYLEEIQQAISRDPHRARVIQKIGYVPDEEIELYFKAADVLVLPYTQVSQSGVLFLGYSFGLPVIAADVGSIREEIVEGETGFLCKSSNPADLADTIETYFESALFKDLSGRRKEISTYAEERHSWDTVGEATRHVYAQLLEG